jgi:hypothetical protein
VRRHAYNAKTGPFFQVHDYMVELPGRDGSPTRLVIREKTFKLKLPLPATVPVVVNKRRTKAAFDLETRESTRSARRNASSRRGSGAMRSAGSRSWKACDSAFGRAPRSIR